MNRASFSVLSLATLSLMPFAHALSGSGVSTTAPTGTSDPGWANIGTVNDGSCVYLGDYASGYWVISAAHVISSASGSVTLNGSSYSILSGTGVQLTNSGNSSYPTADLYLFQISGNSSLSSLNNLTLATSAPGSSLTVIGWGGGTQGYGTVSVIGYNITPGTITVTGSNGNSELLEAQSTNVQLIAGDSGGGMFMKSGNQWELTGISEATGTNGSEYIAVASQISTYATQINGYLTAVPEPSAYGAMAGGSGLIALGLRRRRRAAK